MTDRPSGGAVVRDLSRATHAVEHADVVIIGAGAAGLMTAITAGRAMRDGGGRGRIVLLDSARTIGAKILVAGGGRCNVTHDRVEASAYAGASRASIARVLRRFDVPQTVAFFDALGVPLKREETGKLFPVSDSAKTVLQALLGAARDAGVDLRHPRRVESVTQRDGGFDVAGEWGSVAAATVVLATGGKSLPKTGSDGHGYALARALGHTTTQRITPALVPLKLPKDHFICALSGVTVPTTLTLRDRRGRHLASFTDSTLCTHFGLSGPSVLDISRYWIDAHADNDAVELVINWLPGLDVATLDQLLLDAGQRAVGRYLSKHLPQRLADALCAHAGVEPTAPCRQLPRDHRRTLVRTVTELVLPVTGDRGFLFAEVTGGGVPLAEIDLKTMASRRCPGLHLVGEICDVDGRIGGYNFQWAWASGHVAGTAIAVTGCDGEG